ncbi:MAG TPA: hypothetical protein VHA54_03185 [Solirubrobacterales bacterium]|nr:hypothetical protein [Solirubrobacterales bacterium]
MPERPVVIRAGLAILAIAAVSLLFIASYAGALHEPRPHDVPVAVAAGVPRQVAAELDGSPEIRVVAKRGAAEAMDAIDTRDVYGAVLARGRGLVLVVAPAAGPAVAEALRTALPPKLRRSGVPVAVRTVHPLPEADSRGLVGFYTVVGWIVGGYLGATFLGLIFGTQPGRRHTVWRLGALGILALITGFAGAAVAAGIGDWDASLLSLGLVGTLTVAAVGAVTVALQSVLGLVGTGLAILVFVVLGNPASGGPYSAELLPGLWRAVGQLIPTGAATTALRDIAYFPDAPVGGPVLVIVAWLVAGVVVALGLGQRRGPLTEDEAAASAGAAAAP